MIRNLNPDGFKPFGTILPEKSKISSKPNHHSVSLFADTVSRYYAVADVWLAFESGIAVLSLSVDGESFADFYLDRSLKIKAGSWFDLTAFRGRAAVQMSGISMPRLLQTMPAEDRFSVRPGLQVTRLYTLFYQEKEQGFLFSGEEHPMAELIYVDQGKLHSVAEGQDLLLAQGDMVLYSPNQWHMQYADVGEAPKLVSITFDGEGIPWDKLCNRRFSSVGKAVTFLRMILSEQEKMNAQSRDMIFSLLQMLLLSLQKENKEERQQLPASLNGENEIIRRAQQHIGLHVTDKLTVPAVAAAVEVSASYLTALFHKHLQISPGEYIRRIKLEKSKQMIREGNMNFTEIAETLQYSTIHHFSRQFKQMFSITPTEYAKSVR